jgi:ABC-type sugar transport system permease subunit
VAFFPTGESLGEPPAATGEDMGILATPAREASAARGPVSWGERRQGYLFVLPTVITLFVVMIFPLLSTFYWSVVTESRDGVTFAGLIYFREALESADFWNALRNSLVFTVASVVLHLAVGMPVALLLNEHIPWKAAFRVVAMIPWMFPTVVVGVLWAWLYHPQFGLFNDVALRLGAIQDSIPWLANPTYAMTAILIANLWRGYPFVMLILLAGLAAIPTEQYEAAAVDGAGLWQRFRYITLPNLRFMIVLATLLDTIYMFRHFDLMQVMTAGGPAGATEVLTTLVYKQSFQFFRNEYASAIAILMFLVMFCFSLGYVRLIHERGAARS